MVQAITATYVQEDEEWTIKVAGLGKELDGRAPGIIAARDRADQLVEKLVPEGSTPTVVHLLNGSALEFTTAYMTARLARTEPDAEAEAEAEVTAIAPEKPEDQPQDAPESGEPTADEPKAEEPKAERQDTATAAAAKDTAAQGKQDKDKPAEPAGKRAKAKRAVPRKELAKSPEPTAPKADEGAESTEDKGQGTYVGKVAAAYGGHHAAGSASATG